MPRIKLTARDSYPFQTEMPVRVTDLNYGGHLGNDRLLSLIQEARVAFLAGFGFSEIDCGGVSLILGDTAIVYKGEAFAGDRLCFEVAAGEPGTSGFRLFYRVSRSPENTPIAMAETGMVCFDYQKRRIQPLPKAVKAICTSES